MVSPLNPLKQGQTLEADVHRLAMATVATAHCSKVQPSDFEFDLPKPNFTYRTLTQLRDVYPDCDFTLIVGSDNWLIFDKWRNWQEIIDEFGLLVYPRPGYDVDESTMPTNVRLLAEAPVTDLSSTEIRAALTQSGDTSEMLHPAVKDYIIAHHLYRD
jgi:nicotinate-nucleotide adenylyltransferase